MKISDLFYETYSAITANKARSGLTILGIVIGIASVIVMVAIGRGAQSSIEQSIESIGSNLLIVRPGAQRTPGSGISQGQGSQRTLLKSDAEAITEKIALAKHVAPEISGSYQVIAKGQNTRTSVLGTVSSYADVRSLSMDEGTFLSDINDKNLSKVAVIGPDVKANLFLDGSNPVGQKVRINGIDFTVIGVTASKGGTGFGSSDDVVYIPLSVAQQFLSGSDHLSSINVSVENQESMAVAQEQISELLLAQHNIKNASEADFNIINQTDIVETASSVTETFTILLGAVAGISLVVGGIGIMNMMLTSVTERTREIGLRKAIGAKRRDISLQFLVEATLLTLVGGALGIFLGWLVSFAVMRFAGFAAEISPASVALAFGVSAVIGIVFGYYPARRAAKLNPIDALRYE